MSDSDLSTPGDLPSNSEIEYHLRKVVRDATKNDEEFTVNSVRTRAEKELGLEAGFLKENTEWKQKSKEIISAAVEDPLSPEAPKTKPKPKAKPAAKAGAKRKSEEAQPKKKRQRKAVTTDSEEDESGAEFQESEEEEKPKPSKRAAKSKKAISDDEESEDEKPSKAKSESKSETTSTLSEPPETDDKTDQDVADDSSVYSEVRDDPPPAKKRRQKKSTSPSAAKPKTAKAKPAAKDLSADEEEIKRLQGWLLKCGVRKLWHRELVNCSTSKEKIKHLKKMLDDVGMTGRFSADKAKGIKEKRELAAELEAAQEFNEQWGEEKDGGSGDDDEEEEKEEVKEQPAKRRLPKGLVDFGDSGDDDSE